VLDLPPSLNIDNFVRILNHYISDTQVHLKFVFRVVLSDDERANDAFKGAYLKLKRQCQHNASIRVCLELDENAPPLETVQTWIGEQIHSIELTLSTFISNKANA